MQPPESGSSIAVTSINLQPSMLFAAISSPWPRPVRSSNISARLPATSDRHDRNASTRPTRRALGGNPSPGKRAGLIDQRRAPPRPLHVHRAYSIHSPVMCVSPRSQGEAADVPPVQLFVIFRPALTPLLSLPITVVWHCRIVSVITPERPAKLPSRLDDTDLRGIFVRFLSRRAGAGARFEESSEEPPSRVRLDDAAFPRTLAHASFLGAGGFHEVYMYRRGAYTSIERRAHSNSYPYRRRGARPKLTSALVFLQTVQWRAAYYRLSSYPSHLSP
ncbi:hypothetical protein OH77DRAFT_735976 [Trametes cingulata]|nr:hypothetical protein OH77DRAFT_735976 [Trametes cingulata]